jgi:hypothetical protein
MYPKYCLYCHLEKRFLKTPSYEKYSEWIEIRHFLGLN